VHAPILADEPFEVTLGALDFREAHQGPGVFREVVRVLVLPDVGPDLIAQIVPFHARDLTRLATDALRGIDELGDLLRAHGHADLGFRQGSGGAADDI
jgi:hypothetical protein